MLKHRIIALGAAAFLLGSGLAADMVDSRLIEAHAQKAKKGRAARAAPAAISPRWGFWAQLAGTSWLGDNDSLYTYEWQKRGQILSVRITAPEDTYTNIFTLSPTDSSLNLSTRSGPSQLELLGDGSFVQPDGENRRWRYRLARDQIVLTEEVLGDRGWQPGPAAPIARRRLQPAQIAAEKDLLAKKRQSVLARIQSDWGIVPKLMDQRFLYSAGSADTDTVTRIYWLTRGREAALEWTTLANDSLSGWIKFTQDLATRKIEASNNSGTRGDVIMTADGRIQITWEPTDTTRKYGTLVHDYRLAPGGLQNDTYFVKNGKRRKAGMTSSVYAAVGSKTNQDLRAELASRRQAAAQQLAQSAPQKKSGGGGLFGKILQGALAGAQGMVMGGGASMNEAIAGAGLGAVAGAAGVDAGTISSATTMAMSSSTSGAGSAFAAATGTGGGGAYPTRPNMLDGQSACSMMNEGNYRQVGLSGGNDVQLKTMCAQAYEYYTMYKRAIAQGYSEADANRTYAAHEGAAQNALSFYANNRAD